MQEYRMKEPPKDYIGTHTSKGNQLKWQQDGYWYKANQYGYEGIAEYVVTNFLDKTFVPFSYVSYEPAIITYKSKTYLGCRSKDFYEENPSLKGYEIVPIERLHRQYTTNGLAEFLPHFREVEDRVKYTLDFVTNITGLEGFADYLSFMMEIDTFFLNEDRHTNNIAVMWNPVDDKYDYCPYYDFGLSLFSDTREDFPLDLGYEECRKIIRAKPFSRDFDEQLEAVEALGAYELKLPFSVTDMRKEAMKVMDGVNVQGLTVKQDGISEFDRIKARVIETLVRQAGKYRYMLKG